MSSDGGNGDVADLGGSNRSRAARLPRVITALLVGWFLCRDLATNWYFAMHIAKYLSLLDT
jgi:hypothetical protein